MEDEMERKDERIDEGREEYGEGERWMMILPSLYRFCN